MHARHICSNHCKPQEPAWVPGRGEEVVWGAERHLACMSTVTPVSGELHANESGRAGQGRAGQGRAGQGRAGQGRAGQGRVGQGRWADNVYRDVRDAEAETDDHPACMLKVPYRTVKLSRLQMEYPSHNHGG